MFKFLIFHVPPHTSPLPSFFFKPFPPSNLRFSVSVSLSLWPSLSISLSPLRSLTHTYPHPLYQRHLHWEHMRCRDPQFLQLDDLFPTQQRGLRIKRWIGRPTPNEQPTNDSQLCLGSRQPRNEKKNSKIKKGIKDIFVRRCKTT